MLSPGDDDMELDNMSREAAGRYIVPGKADWSKMEAELDKVLPAEKKKKFSFFWLLPVLLVGGAGYWLLMDKNEKGDIIPANKTITTLPQGAEASNAKEKEQAGTLHIIKDDQPEQTANKRTQFVAPSAKIAADKLSHTANSKGIKIQVPTEKDNSAITNKIATTGIDKETQSALQAAPGNTNTSTTVSGNNQPPVKQNVTIEKSEDKNTSEPTAVSNQLNSSTSENTTEPDKKTVLPNPGPAATPSISKQYSTYGEGLSFSVITGIDKSTVKFSYDENPGYNVGIIGGYHFTNRFSIHTGAIFTQKNYKMAGKDFTAPKGSFVSYYKLETVEGYCRMWEFPLMGRYSFSQNAKNNYFLSAGLSSYFMTGEHYSYFYHYLGQPVTRNASYTVGGNHVFSVMHLSAGFEKRISKNLNLQIEPYAKVPLGGMGYGSIRLSSFGLNLGLQFRQPSRN